MLALALGIVAVGAGFMGAEGVLFVFCGLSVLANGASLLVEGGTVSTAQTAARARRG